MGNLKFRTLMLITSNWIMSTERKENNKNKKNNNNNKKKKRSKNNKSPNVVWET
jgi:hypothetical protein